MQPVLNIWHVLCKEAAVGANAVATQWDLSRLWTMNLDEVECLLHGFGFTHSGHLDEFQETRGGVHFRHEIIHSRKNIIRLENNEVGAFGHNVQFVIGNKGGYLDNDVSLGV